MAMPNRMEMKKCKKPEPHHPCDLPLHCDPCAEDDMECQKPTLCLERLKNPAIPGETTKCRPGAYINVVVCKRPEEPPHPCDNNECIPGFRKQLPCQGAPLCYEKVLNPQKKKEIKCPMIPPSYEAFESKITPCVYPPEYVHPPELPDSKDETKCKAGGCQQSSSKK